MLRFNPIPSLSDKIHNLWRKLLFIPLVLLGSVLTSFGNAIAYEVVRGDDGREDVYIALESFLETIPTKRSSLFHDQNGNLVSRGVYRLISVFSSLIVSFLTFLIDVLCFSFLQRY